MVSRMSLCVLAGLAVGLAHGDEVFIGFDNNLSGAIPMASTPNADAARSAFFGSLSGTVLTQDFETFVNGSVPGTISFGSGIEAAASAGTGQIRDTQLNGGYGVDGARFLYTEPSEGQTALTLTFNTPMRAIGFYHSDASDWFGTSGVPHIQVSLGQEAIYELLEGTSTSDIRSGSVGYFGIVAEQAFTEITIYRVSGGGSTDTIGFDAISVVAVPAPAGAALLGLAALASRRRR